MSLAAIHGPDHYLLHRYGCHPNLQAPSTRCGLPTPASSGAGPAPHTRSGSKIRERRRNHLQAPARTPRRDPVVVSTDKISLSKHGLSLLYWALRRLLELAGSADAVGA